MGTELGQAHQCNCGETVDTCGSHAFSCRRNPGRTHHITSSINNLVCRAMIRAEIPSVKEPNEPAWSDGKRPDGLTSIPWHEGRSATWNVTVTNTFGASYLAMPSVPGASAAEATATRKHTIAEISRVHLLLHNFYSAQAV